MKRMIATLVIAAAGCTSPAPPETEVATPPVAKQSTLEVRLLGANPGALHAVFVEVRELEVTVNGFPLRTQRGQRDINLANIDHAWLVGSFSPPSGADRVHVKLVLDDFGGWESLTGDGDYLDARNSVIEFDAPVRWLSERGRGTVKLDLQRSLVKRADGSRRLVPQMQVLY